MVAPVGFGRSVPLMAPEGSASGGSGKSQLDKAKELMQLNAKVNQNPELSDQDATKRAKSYLRKRANREGLDAALAKANEQSIAVDKKAVLDKHKYLLIETQGTATKSTVEDHSYGQAKFTVDVSNLYNFGLNGYIGPKGELVLRKGVEKAIYGPAPDFAYITEGIRKLKRAANTVDGSLTLQVQYDSAAEVIIPKKNEGKKEHQISIEAGLMDGGLGTKLAYTTPSLVSQDSLRLSLEGSASRSLEEGKWSQTFKPEIKYQQADKKSADKSLLDSAKATFELHNSGDAVESKLVLGLGLFLGDDRELSSSYTRVVFGKTSQNVEIAFETPLWKSAAKSQLLEKIGFKASGSYSTDEAISKLEGPVTPISKQGNEMTIPESKDGTDVWAGRIDFELKFGPATLILGGGLRMAQTFTDDLKHDNKDYFVGTKLKAGF